MEPPESSVHSSDMLDKICYSLENRSRIRQREGGEHMLVAFALNEVRAAIIEAKQTIESNIELTTPKDVVE